MEVHCMTEKNKYNPVIVQSNDLIEAFYDSDLTPTEHKVIRYAASKIKDSPEMFPTVSFDVKEFLEAGGIRSNNHHKRIENIGDELSRKRIKLKNDSKVGWFPWLSSMIYEGGTVTFTFNILLKDLLLELEGSFTKYNYRYISDMRSSYSIRLYELLKQYAPIGKRKFRIDDLKRMLGVENKYPSYGQFKQRVLNQAEKELNKKGGLTFSFEEIKKGRKVHEIVFFISVNEKQLTLTDFMPSAEEQEFLESISVLLEKNQLAVSDEVIRSWHQYSYDLVYQTINEVKGQDMRHPAAYITAVLKNKRKEFLDLSENIKSDDEKVKKFINDFINLKRSREIQPDWFIKQKFVTYAKEHYSDTEIEDMWNDNKAYIEKQIYIK